MPFIWLCYNRGRSFCGGDYLTEVFYGFDHILLSMGYHDPLPHRHLAKNLLISLHDKFVCRINEDRISCTGICIGSDIMHTVQRDSGELLVFLFDETSYLAEQLETQYLKGKLFCILSETLCSRVVEEWEKKHSDFKKFDRDILSECGLIPSDNPKYDSRITEVLGSLHEIEEINSDTLQTFCRAIGLSQSRLSHLFKEQVGISLGSYLVFEKIRKTYTYMRLGEDLTTACIHAGFGSSSHFSVTYKRMFGLSFRDFRKDTIFNIVA